MKPATETRGFTLLELLIVLGILGVLLGLLYPTLTKAVEIIRRTRTRDRIQQISLALEAFKKDFGDYPPSNDGSLRSGAGNLVFYLMGPAGTGWGLGAGGAMPFPGQRPQRSYPPYLTPDESLLVYKDVGAGQPRRIAGLVDAFDPSGAARGKLFGRILYFRARTGQTAVFDHLDGVEAVGATRTPDPRAIESFADQAHFELSAASQAGTGGAPPAYVQEPYLLISPGLDRRYGYVKTADVAGGERDLVPAVSADKDKSCDDVTNFN